MANLSNKKIKESYGGLLNIGLTGAAPNVLYPVTDGVGNVLPIEISTSEVKFTGSVSGLTGAAGSSGTSGINGSSGTSGADGSSGTSGISGSSGTSGVSGSSGTSGADGLTGSSGTSGVNGTSGTDGAAGSSGTSGVNGSSGSSGVSGANGSSGTSGVNGATGATGAAGGLTYISATQAEIKAVGTSPDIAISVMPKGAGQFTTATPDNTAVGGNARGVYAIDISVYRASANRVASGAGSMIVGNNSMASNENSIAMGLGCTSTGAVSTAMGAESSASGIRCVSYGNNANASGGGSVALGYLSVASGEGSIGMAHNSTASGVYSFASGRLAKAYNWGQFSRAGEMFSAQGDAQTSMITLGRQGSVASSGNLVLLPGLTTGSIILDGTNRIWSVQYQLVLVCTTSAGGANDPAVGDAYTTTGMFMLRKVGGTVITPAAKQGVVESKSSYFSGLQQPTLQFTTDGTSLNTTVLIGETSGTNTYRAVATLRITEVGF